MSHCDAITSSASSRTPIVAARQIFPEALRAWSSSSDRADCNCSDNAACSRIKQRLGRLEIDVGIRWRRWCADRWKTRGLLARRRRRAVSVTTVAIMQHDAATPPAANSARCAGRGESLARKSEHEHHRDQRCRRPPGPAPGDHPARECDRANGQKGDRGDGRAIWIAAVETSASAKPSPTVRAFSRQGRIVRDAAASALSQAGSPPRSRRLRGGKGPG